VTTNTEVAQRQEAEALAFSRPLDVHRWSDYPEADAFVDEVYARCQQSKPSNIERKHFKVVVLDLYVAWLEHPDLKLAVSLRPAEYKAKGSRMRIRAARRGPWAAGKDYLRRNA
jgi:hypothetical protein